MQAMNRKALTTARLAEYSLRGNPFRTAGLIVVVAILSFALFGGTILSYSLKNGLNSLKARLGADLAVVPLEHESDYEGIILSGEPSRFYFDKSIARQISNTEGIAQVTSQFFLTTLSSACCSAPVQVVGFDPATDFSILPWISKVHEGPVESGQLIVGSEIVIDSSGTLKFFNDVYSVAAQLDKTSTGMDYSVYADMNTIKTLVAGAQRAEINLSADVFDADIENAISTVLVKVEEGYDADKVISYIRRGVSGVSIVKSQSLFSSIADHLNVLLQFIGTVTLVLWGLSVIVLAVIFSVLYNGRKKEFALYRSLGATRKRLVKIVLTESSLISALGAAAGTITASLVVFPFSNYIGTLLKLPYLLPDAGPVLGALANSLLLSFLVGPLAVLYSAVKVSRSETYTAIREGE